MKILIEIKNKIVKIRLLQKGEEVDFLDIADEYQLSEKLLSKIDQILSKNGLKPEEIDKIEVKSDKNNNFTTTRIAKTAANAWNWTRKMK